MLLLKKKKSALVKLGVTQMNGLDQIRINKR